jgi:AcrR family transcriptional regulator
VIGPGEPLRKPNDLFNAGLARRGRKCRRALDHEGMVRRAVVGSLHTAHRVHQLIGIKDVRNHDLGAAALEQIAASVPAADYSSYRPAFGQQLTDYCATGLSGCAGYQNCWINHSSILVLGTLSYRNEEQMVRYRTGSKRKMSPIKKTKPQSPSSTPQPVSSSTRERVLNAAFSLFREHGFSSTSMLDIVTRARVSKRDLYALFKNKHAVLATCISEHAQQMRRPLAGANSVPPTRDALAALLVEFGAAILQTVCHPDTLTVFRLAIAESDRAPEIGRTLESNGREANHKVLAELIKKGQARKLIIPGEPAVLAQHYIAALWGDLLIRLLMRTCEAPTEREIEARARAATETLISPR